MAALLAGCGGTHESPAGEEGLGAVLDRVGFLDLPGWGDDDVAAALPAWRASCGATGDKAAGNGLGSPADWAAACAASPADGASAEAVRRYVESHFAPFLLSDPDGGAGLFTGYYEPEIAGARRRSADFPVPLYKRPDDVMVVDGRTQPYLTRADIDGGALAKRGLELLWLANPIDAFFLQVQGSGRVRLDDGRIVRVGYAGDNGHPYTAIGRILVERGELTKEAASLQTIRQWLRDHPAEAEPLMHRNKRYIFFREISGDGPIGSQGVALTPGRSLAVDPAHIPMGALLWLDSTYPAGTPETGRPLRRLMVAQDTGSAIKGVIRGDVFWGSGDDAARYAGPMKQSGRLYLLLPMPAREVSALHEQACLPKPSTAPIVAAGCMKKVVRTPA